MEALNNKIVVSASLAANQINLVILSNDFIARVIFINVNVLDTLSRKPVKHKSRGSMVFKDSCRVQDVKNEGNYTFVFFRGIEMKTEKLARSTNKQIRHASSTFNFHHTKHLAPLVEKKLPLRRSIDRNVLSFKKKKITRRTRNLFTNLVPVPFNDRISIVAKR